MSLVSEYRNIQSRVMLSFSRMSCRAVRVSPVPCTRPQEEECRGPADINWQNEQNFVFTLVPPPSPTSILQMGKIKVRKKERLALMVSQGRTQGWTQVS